MANINTWPKSTRKHLKYVTLNGKVFKVKDMMPELMLHLCTLGVEVLQ